MPITISRERRPELWIHYQSQKVVDKPGTVFDTVPVGFIEADIIIFAGK